MKLDRNNHSVFSLNYHLVLVIKNRRKVINNEISEKVKQMFLDRGNKYRITFREWNHDQDHGYVLFILSRNFLSPSMLTKVLVQGS